MVRLVAVLAVLVFRRDLAKEAELLVLRHENAVLRRTPGGYGTRPVQQGGQERPVGRGEPRPVRAQLPLQDRDLVAQCQDFRVLVTVAHRQQPQ